jgi:hypothetical protein
MTLREFFDFLGDNPLIILAYFFFIPFTAWVAGLLGRGEGHLSPWKYLYAALIYAVCIPGIFALTLSVYLFMFERGSVMNVDVLLQALPILSMVLTLAIIRRAVDFDLVPGFGKISSLMMLIATVFILMYLADRTHLIAFVNVPVHYLALIVLGLVLLFRLAFKRLLA